MGRTTRSFGYLAVALLAALVSGAAPRATAHDDDLSAHPAQIVRGTCAAPGDLVFPLNPIGALGTIDGVPLVRADPAGAASVVPVEIGAIEVGAALAAIVSGGHAITVFRGEDDPTTPIACGDIDGEALTGPGMAPDGTLAVGLLPAADSGAFGVAVLAGDGDRTQVTVYLATGATLGANAGTPTANRAARRG